ncbi:NHL repeat-containing protein [Roseococcus thiosulfatophilus]|uniref:peptidase n=1 Tax=Roseococcus thiosulfatophilus TaxID=35813 RepID=UPI001A90902A|nr:peptidase [Roseococcus thiosulfatophilus]
MLYVTLGARRYRIERPWGDLPTDMGGVTDVATDADGRIYVGLRRDSYTSAPGPTVIVLDAAGARIGAFGEEVADLHMLDVAPDGLIHVVDRDAHEIIAFDREGVVRRRLGTRHQACKPFNSPCDIGFAPDGTAYVADGYAASRVHVFAPDGTPREGWGTPGQRAGEFSTPHSVRVGVEGEVAVADRENNRVQVFTLEGRFLRSLYLLHKPMAVTADAEGNWWVTDQVPSLSVFSRQGVLISKARAVLNGAHGMALHPDGSVLLAEMTPSRLTRLVPE